MFNYNYEPYISLSELNNAIQRAISRTNTKPTWVLAEIADIKYAVSNHAYLELVEKDKNNTIAAKIQAVIWVTTVRQIYSKYKEDMYHLLKKGNKMLMLCTVEFHTVYGLKLIITDINPTITLGEMELKRQQTLQKLKDENLINQNRTLNLPLVLQKVAVISSVNAAGYIDFITHLKNNPYKYVVYTQFFQCAMQGNDVEIEMVAQLQAIEQQKEAFDLVVIIRGGGSSLDLECFNNYNICKQIANMSIPVFTGIGHQQDVTLIDIVAFKGLKTPTAVAEEIINSFITFESNVLKLKHKVLSIAKYQIDTNVASMNFIKQKFKSMIQQAVYIAQEENKKQIQKAFIIANNIINENIQDVKNVVDKINELNPITTLKKGYTITKIENTDELVQNINNIPKNTKIVTYYYNEEQLKKIISTTT